MITPKEPKENIYAGLVKDTKREDCSNFDPYRYTVSIRRELSDGEILFVARVAELPDIILFEESYKEAYEGAISVIDKSYEMYSRYRDDFPKPEEPEYEIVKGEEGFSLKRFEEEMVYDSKLLPPAIDIVLENISFSSFVNILKYQVFKTDGGYSHRLSFEIGGDGSACITSVKSDKAVLCEGILRIFGKQIQNDFLSKD